MKTLLNRPLDSVFVIDIGHVPVFTGALLGAMLVFLFSSFAIKAVGRTAQTVIEEVRRQFRENPASCWARKIPITERAWIS